MVITWFQAAALGNPHGNSCLIGPATYCETLHISPLLIFVGNSHTDVFKLLEANWLLSKSRPPLVDVVRSDKPDERKWGNARCVAPFSCHCVLDKQQLWLFPVRRETLCVYAQKAILERHVATKRHDKQNEASSFLANKYSCHLEKNMLAP